jgi:hypothetical protein
MPTSSCTKCVCSFTCGGIHTGTSATRKSTTQTRMGQPTRAGGPLVRLKCLLTLEWHGCMHAGSACLRGTHIRSRALEGRRCWFDTELLASDEGVTKEYLTVPTSTVHCTHDRASSLGAAACGPAALVPRIRAIQGNAYFCLIRVQSLPYSPV